MAKAGNLKIAKAKPKKRKLKQKPKPKKKQKAKVKAKDKKKEEAYEAIEKMLNKARDKLIERGYTADARLHRNRDGSLDSELRVVPKRGQKVNDIFIDMGLDAKPIPNTWVSTGIRYKPRETEESGVPGEFKGLLRFNSHYQRNTRNKLAANFTTGREINKRLGEDKLRKPEHVLMKVHWNSDKDKRPDRDEVTKGRKKR